MNLQKLCRANLFDNLYKVYYKNQTIKTGLNYVNIHNNNINLNNHVKSISTIEAKGIQKEEGIVNKILKKITFVGLKKARTKVAAYMLYENIVDKINCIDFFEELNIPDTFYSWFVITELHIWMLSARAMAEGDEGRYLRNCLVEALWSDVAQRVKKLGAGNPAEMREQVAELSEQLQAALLAYDEGLQSNDTVLAGAIWRRIYQQKDIHIESLDILVKYIRKQINLLDNYPQEQLFKEKYVNWEPIKNFIG